MPEKMNSFVAIVPPDQKVYEKDAADGQVEAQDEAGAE